MIVVGIVGGIASGKSVVADEFKALGAVCIDADRVGHQVLEEQEVVDALVNRWGDAIIDPETGKLNRLAIAKIVFGEHEDAKRELEFLESISHPRISTSVKNKISQSRLRGERMVILDAALLIKAGWDSMCDFVVYVDVDRSTRLERAKLRGWTEQEYTRREQSQAPLAEKRQKADILIDNSHGLGETRNQVRTIWDRLVNQVE
jgi:dephospho-CoA kinase